MIRFFIGKVESVNGSVHTIEFSMSDFTGSYIKIPAVPLSPITTLPSVDDEVMILQPNSDIEVFYYTQMPKSTSSESCVQLKYGNSVVKIFKDSSDKFNISLVLDDTNPNSKRIEIDSQKVLINGHLKVT